MINLLPTEIKTSYHFARSNRRLLPWLTALVVALILLIIIALYGSSTLNQTAQNYQQQINSSQQQLASARVASVQAKVSDISVSLRLVTDVLQREVLFSKLLTQISTVVPNGVNLTGLNINQDDSAIDVQAAASNYQAATQLQANLTDPANRIFSKADLISVDCTKSTNSTTDPQHPCAVDIKAEFNPVNQFLFINNKTEVAK